jgi:hypothetical protein
MMKQHGTDGGNDTSQQGQRPGVDDGGKGMMHRRGEHGGTTGSTPN